MMVYLSFQVFKFIYLCRLAEMGLATQAFHYCEVIAKSILTQPGAYSLVLISQLIQVRIFWYLPVGIVPTLGRLRLHLAGLGGGVVVSGTQ